MSSSIRIAISGGGLAAVSLLHALVQFSHLDVHVFEPATAVVENTGATVGVARNGMAALNLIGPSIVKCLENTGAIPTKGLSLLLGQGPNQGSKVADHNPQDPEKGIVTMAPTAAFLQELLAGLPQGRIHTSKKLSKVDRKADGHPLILYFTDETTHECDILIGADGIQSTVRKFVLGENDPTASPRNTGYWVVRAIKSYAEAQAILGKDRVDIDNPREFGWIGDGATILHTPFSPDQKVLFLICAYEQDAESSDRWTREVHADEIKQLYQHWMPHLYKAVDEFLCSEPKHRAIYVWELPDAASYVSGPICIIGDAAHAVAPWQGASAGLSFEDILILSTLLGRAKSSTEGLVALRVYDQIRRPRTQAIVRSSRETGEITTGRSREIKLDLEALRESLTPKRWSLIVDFDVEKHRDQAVEMMEAELKKGE